ncbi:MAG: hypothetical protein ACRDBY_13940 [Cetobacterium sp.]
MAEKNKVTTYIFTHPNKYLYVADCKAQFIDGMYKTTNLEVAKYLANICDMTYITE